MSFHCEMWRDIAGYHARERGERLTNEAGRIGRQRPQEDWIAKFTWSPARNTTGSTTQYTIDSASNSGRNNQQRSQS